MVTTVETEVAGNTWDVLANEIGARLEQYAATHDISGEINVDAFNQLRASGLTAALVPRDFGGGGATHFEMGQILRVLGRYDPATAVTLSMHTHLVATQVWRHKQGMDAEGVLRKVAEGAILISTGANDWLSSSGEATKVDGGFRVSAAKGPASGCEVGQVLVTSIRWQDAPDGPQVFHCAVPMNSDGISIDKTWDTLGLRATGSHTVVLDNVLVPDSAIALFRPADVWHPFWNAVIGAAAPIYMSGYLGVADAAVNSAKAAMKGRSDPHVVSLMGQLMNAHVTASDLIGAMFVDSNDLQFENSEDHTNRNLCRKTVATDAMIETLRIAMELAGGQSYKRNALIARLYRDIHGAQFHPLPKEKQLMFSGQIALGLQH